MKLFIAPHNDDEVLFGAWTLLTHREEVTVAIVYDSFVQASRGVPGCDAAARRRESIAALAVLGIDRVHFLGLRDCDPIFDQARWEHALDEIIGDQQPEAVFAPAWEQDGHPQHNFVGAVSVTAFRNLTRYLTYTAIGRSTVGREVAFKPEWVRLKLQALACYKSQFDFRLGCWPHFLGSQREYYAR